MLTDFLFSVALGLAAAHGLSLVAVCRLLIAALLSLQSTGSGVLEHGLSCSEACGIFLDKGSNPCPRHWQVSCQEDPCFSAFCLYVEIHFYAFEGQGHVPGYCPWWPGGQDSALSLLWPDLSLSPGTEILPQAAAG